ncbi:MAG: TetR/AcrR family transcriptional regulator [Deltaproteobacteria bacterium]|nr:TetR/AcrR family transcriptional regulator [Deltaproteobacteria bacterium]
MGLPLLANKKQSADKHQKIIEAAIAVFAGNGFFNSTVADVAREADVADGTIYLYFKNKDDLLISIFEYSMDLFIQEAEAALKSSSDPKEKLREFISLHLKLVQKYPDLAQVIQIELRQSTKFMKEYPNEKFFQYLDIVSGIIGDGQESGVFKKNLDPVILKRVIFGAVDEIALEWTLMKRKRYTMAEAADQVCGMIFEGICQ